MSHADSFLFPSSAFRELVAVPESDQLPDTHPYVYVAVRTDIPLHQQLVQAGHAAFEAGLRWHSPDEEISSLIVLEVPNLKSLHKLRRKLEAAGVAHHLFHEPDFGIGDSALSTEPLYAERRQIMAGYPLWGVSPATRLTSAAAHQEVMEVAHG